MIFATIKLIVVYGSEMQECEAEGRKRSRLMEGGAGDIWGRGCDHGINLRRGTADFGANCGGDCGLT